MHRYVSRRTLYLLTVVAIAALAGLVAWLWLATREALPRYHGEVTVADLSAPVAVTFGPHAVPHVRAAQLEDLFLAQGYLVARERLWQMDMVRRLARGRLAEVLGPGALPVDRLFRVLGLGRAAEASGPALGDEVTRYLEAYARGVNAYRREALDRPPLEYRLARFGPAPWEPVDSLAIVEYMAFMLSFNARHELTFLKLSLIHI